MPTPIDPKVEIDLGGTWTDITSYVRYDQGITITRGRASEDAEVPPGTANFKIDNTDGRFSPRNPTSPYYGLIGRNTPVRISVPYGETYLRIRDLVQYSTTAVQSAVTCPDAAALGITGDIDIRIDLTPLSWRGSFELCSKYSPTSNQRSWALTMSDGYITLFWSTDGTLANRKSATSTVQVPAAFGRLALRATLDVNNGAGGYDVKFYTAPTISGSWTQLGSTVTGTGVTSIFDSTATVVVGDVLDLSGEAVGGYYHAFQLLSGIGGTVVANPDFSIQTSGATSFADTASSPNTWTVSSEAYLSDRLYRFTGEISSWPQRWDITGTDAWVDVQASGILRRLQQGQSPVKSTLRRQLSTVATDIVAYWPMEDAGGSQFSSALSGHPPLAKTVGTDSDAGASSDFVGSAPLPTFTTGQYRALVPGYTATTATQVRFLLAVPSGGLTSAKLLVKVMCTGTARRWDVWWSTTNTLHITVYDSEGVQLATQDTGLTCNGQLLRVSLELTQSGADIGYKLVTLEQGQITGFFNSYTLASNTVGRVTSISVGGESSQDLLSTVIGHVSVSNVITSIFDTLYQFNGWGAILGSGSGSFSYRGEPPSTRITRLTEESGLPALEYTSYGLGTESVTLGVQGVKTYLELVREAVASSLGVLFECRDRVALGYRSLMSLYNQAPKITLSYTGHDLADSLNPTDDDQSARNDITVIRAGGSSARATLDSGALSTQDPPDGIGLYDEAVTISLGTDDQLEDQAGWRLHLGTVDEARYPEIRLNLRHSPFDVAATRLAVLIMDVGDRLVVTDVPSQLPPDDISQLVLGYSERFDQFEHTMTINCAPESPYRVATADDATYGIADTEGSSLSANATSTATSISVATTSGPLWTTTAADCPFDISVGGEVMTVTAVSGSSSPQTFTVTRSVNGVVKAQTSGTDVRLAHPAIVGLF